MVPFLIAFLGIFGLMVFWVGVQHLVRKSSPELPPDCDVLLEGGRCPICHARDTCALFKPDETTPDQAAGSPRKE